MYLDLAGGKRTDVGCAAQTRKALLVANIKNVPQEGPGGQGGRAGRQAGGQAGAREGKGCLFRTIWAFGLRT